MIRYVIDASAAAEYLLRTPLGLKLADLIANLERGFAHPLVRLWLGV